MIRLKIWLTTVDGSILPVGELVAADPAENGSLMGQFRYDNDFLHSPAAFALDPLHLPLTSEIFDANRPYAGVHGIFEDSLPDDWGRKLLVRQFALARDRQRIPHLLEMMGSGGLGALSFGEDYPHRKPTGTAGTQLAKLVQLAAKFEQDNASVDDDLTMLFEAGSSPGGARPKVVVEHNDKSWIAKFPSARDTFDVVRLEAAAMCLARQAGVITAHTELFECGQANVLLVERFDLTPAGGRRHPASMQTLTGADGYYHRGYGDLADIIRRVSARPTEDLHRLYKQMIFNVLIGNTDDHLKNFCMLHGEDGWRLSPAFDLVPNVGQNKEHQIHIGNEFRPGGRNILLQMAKLFGINDRQRANESIQGVFEAVSNWQEIFAKHQVPAKDCEILGRDINKRLSYFNP